MCCSWVSSFRSGLQDSKQPQRFWEHPKAQPRQPLFFSSQSKFLRIRMEMMVVSYSLDLAQGAIQLVQANFCKSTRATQLVHTEGKLRTSCQKERSSGGGKYGKIQRGFHSQRHRHRDPE